MISKGKLWVPWKNQNNKKCKKKTSLLDTLPVDQLTDTLRCWLSFLFSETQSQLLGSKPLHFIAEMIYSRCFHCTVCVPLC